MGYNQFILNGVTKFDLTGDTVDAQSLLTGFTAHGADGELIVGTRLPQVTRLYSGEFQGSYSSTSSAVATTVSCGASAFTGDGLLYVRTRDKAGVRTNRYYGTDTLIFNYKAAQGLEEDDAITATGSGGMSTTFRTDSNKEISSYGSYRGYGLYAHTIKPDGDLILRWAYHSTYTGTINGTFLIDVYLLYGLVNGWYGT